MHKKCFLCFWCTFFGMWRVQYIIRHNWFGRGLHIINVKGPMPDNHKARVSRPGRLTSSAMSSLFPMLSIVTRGCSESRLLETGDICSSVNIDGIYAWGRSRIGPRICLQTFSRKNFIGSMSFVLYITLRKRRHSYLVRVLSRNARDREVYRRSYERSEKMKRVYLELWGQKTHTKCTQNMELTKNCAATNQGLFTVPYMCRALPSESS
jgi:hypothetical protein